ncbi:MAG: homocysteine S-methyltransferase family protein [Candidatus Peribacter sp.]|nr:homocysteine S-methyltransferase family protein [Candidatus Peribacter sp.]
MDLRETLTSGRILLADGGMGTELAKVKPVSLQGNLSANCTHPLDVARIHLHYIRAGSRAITTNTFLLNALTPAQERQQVDLDRMNKTGVALARNMARSDHFVLGGMGPTGRLFGLDECMTDEAVRAAYLAQAKSLTSSGDVDGLIIETMTSLREALLALEACKEVTDKPVIASMTFYTMNRDIRTMNGESAAECAQKLAERGADAVGTNCSTFLMHQMAEVVARMRAVTSLPIIAQPNAGQPHGEEGTYIMTPQEFAEGVKLCIDAGATVVGGCCGAGPECIGEVAKRIKHH